MPNIIHHCHCAMLSHSVCVWLFATPWTIVHQAPLFTGFSRHRYWSGFPCPPPGDLPNLETELASPALQADSLQAELPGKPIIAIIMMIYNYHLFEWWNYQTLVMPNTRENVEHQEFTLIAGENAKWYSHFGGHFDTFLQSYTYIQLAIAYLFVVYCLLFTKMSWNLMSTQKHALLYS